MRYGDVIKCSCGLQADRKNQIKRTEVYVQMKTAITNIILTAKSERSRDLRSWAIRQHFFMWRASCCKPEKISKPTKVKVVIICSSTWRYLGRMRQKKSTFTVLKCKSINNWSQLQWNIKQMCYIHKSVGLVQTCFQCLYCNSLIY